LPDNAAQRRHFIDRAGQGAFADHIYAAMCGLSGTSEQEDTENGGGGEEEASEAEGQEQEVVGAEQAAPSGSNI